MGGTGREFNAMVKIGCFVPPIGLDEDKGVNSLCNL